MERNSNVYFHAGLQVASVTCYLLLAGESQGYCSFTSVVTATALQYIRSNQINDKNEHFICKPAMVFIAVGCLFSRTGIKVWGLSLAYFATVFEVIHYHRPKDVILPPPPKRPEPVREIPRPRTPPIVVRKLRPKHSPNKNWAEMRAKTHTLQVLNLYLGKTSLGGYSFERILAFEEAELEMNPAVIHWLFPAEIRIKQLEKVPMITDELIEAFTKDSVLQEKQKAALMLILNHFGLKLDEDDTIVKNPENFESKKKHLSGDNFHRITCILSSLFYFGREGLAQSFYDCLEGLSQEGEIGAEAFLVDCWQSAKSGDMPKLEADPRPLFPPEPMRLPVPVRHDDPPRVGVRAEVLEFYSGIKMVSGHSIDDATSLVWENTPEIIEYMHWIFPVEDRRAPAIGRPTLNAATIERFRVDESLREKQRVASLHLLTLFGLELNAARKIVKTDAFEMSKPNIRYAYKTQGTFNRISPSLRALGNGDLADALDAFVNRLSIAELMSIVS
jgi:hypothetical protein